jgi:predicted amidohydrolase YtcJ
MIAQGMLADLTAIARDPRTIPAAEIRDPRSSARSSEGKQFSAHGSNVARCMLHV